MVWCYDYLLTLDREIAYIWRAKSSFNKILFIGYRYPVLINTILVFLTVIPWSWQNLSVYVTYTLNLFSLLMTNEKRYEGANLC